jgi:hypothetical protein
MSLADSDANCPVADREAIREHYRETGVQTVVHSHIYLDHPISWHLGDGVACRERARVKYDPPRPHPDEWR